MNFKRSIVFVVISMVSLFFLDVAFATKKEFKKPDEVKIKHEDYLDEKYLAEIKELEFHFQNMNDQYRLKIIDKIKTTLDKHEALVNIKELKKGLSDKNIIEKINLIKNEIKENTFNKNKIGVSFEVDKKAKIYKLSWKDERGYIEKNIPFLPDLYLEIEANYLCDDGICRYEYNIHNKKKSNGSFSKLYLESMFKKNIFKSLEFKQYKNNKILDKNNIWQNIWFPAGNLNYFIFWQYYGDSGELISYSPGEKMITPFVMNSFEKSSMGIVDCFIPVDEFKPELILSAENDPDIALDLFTTKPNTRTKFMYQSSTIGPVPSIEGFSNQEIVDKIKTYLDRCYIEGWISKESVFEEIDLMLSKIKNISSQKNIIEFNETIKKYLIRKEIDLEVYLLLSNNIDYLK